MGSFAFVSSYVPGSSDNSPFTILVKTALGKDPSIGELAGLRRLFNESYAAASAEMKTLVEQSDDIPIRKLAPPERAEKFAEQQKKLKGLKHTGHLEPGNSLVDFAVAIYESDRLKYLEWHVCISREIVTSSKKDIMLTFDASGSLKMTKKDNITPCDASTDLQVKYCLTRRGLALEQANMMLFENHEVWAEKLFTVRLRKPPVGYSRISFKQLQLADAKLFVVLGEKTRGGVELTATGRPCDNVFKDAMDSPEVLHLLQPMPPNTARNDEVEKVRSRSPDGGRPKGKGKGKNKPSKGKGKRTWMPSVPHELLSLGCVGMNANNEALCYDWNLGSH